MAFLPNAQDPNQQQGQQQNQIPTVPQIPSLQGTSGPTASASTGTQGATNTAAPGAAPSTPWQNITSYLSANAGQAGNVADVISGNLQSQYNQANQAIGQAQHNVGQEIEGARNPFNQDVASRAAAAPSQFAQNPNDVASFQKMFGGQYQGPQSFSGSSDYSNLQSQVQHAQKQAALTNQGTEGLMTLLQQAESANGQNPTQGITSLDSLLLQESPENFGKISAAAAPFAGLTGYLSSTQQGLDMAAQNASKEAAATQAQLQGQFMGPGGVVPGFEDKLNQEVQAKAAEMTGAGNRYSDLIGQIGSRGLPGLSTAWQQKLGVDPNLMAAEQTLPVAANQLSTQAGWVGQTPFNMPGETGAFTIPDPTIMTPTSQNVATPQEYADAAALAQLTGQAMPLGADTANQAGTFNYAFPNPTFNNQAAAQDLLNYAMQWGGNPAGFTPNVNPATGTMYDPTGSMKEYQQGLAALYTVLGQPVPPAWNYTPPAPPAPPSGPPFLQPLSPTTAGGGGKVFY